MSYNSTGMNTLKTKWIRDLSDVTRADFISIQEHFEVTKSLENYFQEEFPASTSYVIPAQRGVRSRQW